MYVKLLIYGEINEEEVLLIANNVDNDVRTVHSISMKSKLLSHCEIKLKNSK